jgi:hypothetical protein
MGIKKRDLVKNKAKKTKQIQKQKKASKGKK